MDSGDSKTDILGQSNDQAVTLIEPADEQEEYESLLYPQNADKRRIKAR